MLDEARDTEKDQENSQEPVIALSVDKEKEKEVRSFILYPLPCERLHKDL